MNDKDSISVLDAFEQELLHKLLTGTHTEQQRDMAHTIARRERARAIICVECKKKAFVPKIHNQIRCSERCQMDRKNLDRRRQPPPARACLLCDKPFDRERTDKFFCCDEHGRQYRRKQRKLGLQAFSRRRLVTAGSLSCQNELLLPESCQNES